MASLSEFRYELLPLTEADLDEVCAIEEECFSSPWPIEHFRYAVANPRVFTLAARESDRIAAYAVAYFGRIKCLIANLAVRPGHRRRGLASRLLVAALREAKRRGCLYATLDVRRSNTEAIRLYEKFGFRVFGERRAYYSRPREDALTMTLALGPAAVSDDDS